MRVLFHLVLAAALLVAGSRAGFADPEGWDWPDVTVACDQRQQAALIVARPKSGSDALAPRLEDLPEALRGDAPDDPAVQEVFSLPVDGNAPKGFATSTGREASCTFVSGLKLSAAVVSDGELQSPTACGTRLFYLLKVALDGKELLTSSAIDCNTSMLHVIRDGVVHSCIADPSSIRCEPFGFVEALLARSPPTPPVSVAGTFGLDSPTCRSFAEGRWSEVESIRFNETRLPAPPPDWSVAFSSVELDVFNDGVTRAMFLVVDSQARYGSRTRLYVADLELGRRLVAHASGKERQVLLEPFLAKETDLLLPTAFGDDEWNIAVSVVRMNGATYLLLRQRNTSVLDKPTSWALLRGEPGGRLVAVCRENHP